VLCYISTTNQFVKVKQRDNFQPLNRVVQSLRKEGEHASISLSAVPTYHNMLSLTNATKRSNLS